MIQIRLPWPPSSNTYYRCYHNRVLISDKGRRYKTTVLGLWLQSDEVTLGDVRIALTIDAYPPDKRKRDLDNIIKPLQDALNGLAWIDDSQIDVLNVRRFEPAKPGYVRLTAVEML